MANLPNISILLTGVNAEPRPVFIALIAVLLAIVVWFTFIIIIKNNRLTKYKARIGQKLMTHSVRSQEEERKRIASVIHDNFCARLSIIKLMLHNTDPGTEVPEEIFNRIDEAYHEARTLSHHLDSPVLERMGLLDAIRDYIRPLYGILHIEVHILQVYADRLAKHIELHLFRILQEAVTNIIRHANAGTVQIDIRFSRQFAALRITDNGIGFNAKDRPDGAGLKNIKIRVAMLGGNYRMRSKPKQGSSLLVMIPLENNMPRQLSGPVIVYDDDFDHDDINIYLNAKKQFLYADGTNFVFSTRRRRTPFYKRYRKHHTSKNKAQGTVRGW